MNLSQAYEVEYETELAIDDRWSEVTAVFPTCMNHTCVFVESLNAFKVAFVDGAGGILFSQRVLASQVDQDNPLYATVLNALREFTSHGAVV